MNQTPCFPALHELFPSDFRMFPFVCLFRPRPCRPSVCTSVRLSSLLQQRTECQGQTATRSLKAERNKGSFLSRDSVTPSKISLLSRFLLLSFPLSLCFYICFRMCFFSCLWLCPCLSGCLLFLNFNALVIGELSVVVVGVQPNATSRVT